MGVGQYTKFMWIKYGKFLGQYVDIIPDIGLERCLGQNVDFFPKYDLTEISHGCAMGTHVRNITTPFGTGYFVSPGRYSWENWDHTYSCKNFRDSS